METHEKVDKEAQILLFFRHNRPNQRTIFNEVLNDLPETLNSLKK